MAANGKAFTPAPPVPGWGAGDVGAATGSAGVPGAPTAAALAWAAVAGGLGVLVVAVLVGDAVRLAAPGAARSADAMTSAVVALALLLVARVWPVLPGRVGELPTRGWATVLCVALPLVAGPVPAVLCAAMGTGAGLLVDRRRSSTATMAADVVGTAVAGAALAVTGAGGLPDPTMQSGAVGILHSSVCVLAFLAGHLATLTVIEHGGRAYPVLPVLRRRAGDSGLRLAMLALIGPAVAVLLPFSPWLALAMLAVVTVMDVLAAGKRVGRAGAVDELTGLPNRHVLQAQIDSAVARATAGGPPVTLMVVDLDRFQEINDGHGHLVGDRVLKIVAERLKAATRSCDVVARLGGDEFGVLVPGVRDIDGLVDLAHRLRASLSDRIEGRDDVFGPGASIGIVVAPDHALTSSQLMARADYAVHLAKDSAIGVRVYDGRTDQGSSERLSVVAAVRAALDNGMVELAYQPKVALAADGGHDRIVGVEALLRITEPGAETVEPGRLINLVESTGLMGRLTGAILDRALDQVARWIDLGERIPVAVNVSLRDLEDPGFADRAYAALVRAGVPGSLLTLEITERVLTGDLSAVVHSMERLQRIGVRMSLDDFGTGWSSLLLLRRLPVAEVKLDRSFVDGIDGNDADAAVVETVVALTKRLGLVMVAEGVERPETLARLRRFGCDVAQGFLLGGPLPPAEVVPWAARQPPSRLRVVS